MLLVTHTMRFQRLDPFSFHALQRLWQRTSLTCADVMRMIDERRFVNLGTKPGVHRRHLLLFSITDQSHFVAIQDSFDGTLVTILPLAYHERLAWDISEDQLAEAQILAERPPDPKSPQKTSPTTLSVTAYYSDEYGCPTQTIIAKLKIETHGSDIQELINDQFTLRTIIRSALRKGVDPNTIKSITIRAGRKGHAAVFNPGGQTSWAYLWAKTARELSVERPDRTQPVEEPEYFYIGCRFRVSKTQVGFKALGRVKSEPYGHNLRQLLSDESFFAWVSRMALTRQIVPDSINAISLRLCEQGERFLVEIDDLTPSGVAFVRSD